MCKSAKYKGSVLFLVGLPTNSQTLAVFPTPQGFCKRYYYQKNGEFLFVLVTISAREINE